jgi:hypothetical protein
LGDVLLCDLESTGVSTFISSFEKEFYSTRGSPICQSAKRFLSGLPRHIFAV